MLMHTPNSDGADIRLDPEARRILGFLATGLSNAEVGDRLGIGHDAVRWHLRRAMRALGVGSKLAAVLRAIDLGLIEPPG